ncbi:hypothetical protein M408DRAFT_332929 [Serendipita vermifera MAFF 305830]|uniref:Uncharacterized protein n=1 Tax=Serendipita vermifera MAFF 305830 TaxID=933852 RepID=A0A0C3AQS0_SERVB|nr:hypothetical protein M408DRAFT_332929 [Serendipita vermifera MAFF 305830]
MHGWSTTLVLLTLATLLDDILNLAHFLAQEKTSVSSSGRFLHTLSSPPPSFLWPSRLTAAASPVGGPDEHNQRPMALYDANGTREGAADKVERIGEAHVSRPAPVTDGNDDYDEEQGKEEEPIGSNAPMGWADPRLRGGRMLDFVSPGLGEPLNVIISGLSDPYILTPRGLLHYAQTLGFSTECLGIHLGMLHVANLGDALDPSPSPSLPHPPQATPKPTPVPPGGSGGNKTEQLIVRQNYDWPMYGWPDFGTCWETIIGGNGFRAWKQDGAGARTGAWFIAASREMWIGMGHAISPDGYNGGRDGIVKRALKPTRWSPTEEGIWWRTTLKYNTTLIPPGNQGINHKIFQDGRVAILTVRRRDGPPKKKELVEAWADLAREDIRGALLDWETRAEARRARWELEGEEDL